MEATKRRRWREEITKETSPESFELPPEIIKEILIRLPDKSIGGLIKELKVPVLRIKKQRSRILMVNMSQSPCVYSLSRMKESAATNFKTFQFPVDWMLENDITSQIKLASVKVAMKYMKRVSAELEAIGGGGPEEEELIVQGVRFVFRVHQFAGGFDAETMRAFQELRDQARSCHIQDPNIRAYIQGQQAQILQNRSLQQQVQQAPPPSTSFGQYFNNFNGSNSDLPDY